jgi:hypothetical protein
VSNQLVRLNGLWLLLSHVQMEYVHFQRKKAEKKMDFQIIPNPKKQTKTKQNKPKYSVDANSGLWQS